MKQALSTINGMFNETMDMQNQFGWDVRREVDPLEMEFALGKNHKFVHTNIIQSRFKYLVFLSCYEVATQIIGDISDIIHSPSCES